MLSDMWGDALGWKNRSKDYRLKVIGKGAIPSGDLDSWLPPSSRLDAHCAANALQRICGDVNAN
jgi:hypothetical protein